MEYERKWGDGEIIGEVERGTEIFLWVEDSRGALKNLGKREGRKPVTIYIHEPRFFLIGMLYRIIFGSVTGHDTRLRFCQWAVLGSVIGQQQL